MSASVGDIVAQLRDVRERLANAAVTAMRAKADTDQAHSRYAEVAQGTNDPLIKRAIDEIHTASDKTAKYARLLEGARSLLAAYSNKIAPGSAPGQESLDAPMPSGEQLVEEVGERFSARRGAGAFLRKSMRNAENLKDAAKVLTGVGEKGVKILRNPGGSPGPQPVTSSTIPAFVPTQPRSKIEVSEAGGQLVIVGLIVGAAINQADRLIRKGMARLRTYERKSRAK
ncbi:hypothetical protein ACWDV4_10060 [Micromonospora sp. NPDC003197]